MIDGRKTLFDVDCEARGVKPLRPGREDVMAEQDARMIASIVQKYLLRGQESVGVRVKLEGDEVGEGRGRGQARVLSRFEVEAQLSTPKTPGTRFFCP